MRVLASDRKLVEFTVDDGPVTKRDKDQTFHVPDHLGRQMVNSSEWAQVGTTLRSVSQTFVCPSCKRENVIKDSCGGCGWHE